MLGRAPIRAYQDDTTTTKKGRYKMVFVILGALVGAGGLFGALFFGYRMMTR